MSRETALPGSRVRSPAGARLATLAWVLAAVACFHQYLLRSAPAVMMPQLSEGFSLDAAGVAVLLGLFYYGYSPFSLVAGISADHFGSRRLLPVGAASVGFGALLFATADPAAAGIGRFLQGIGGALALVGAIDMAARSFPASRTATLIGITQMFGMAGAAAGLIGVPRLLAGGVIWSRFWAAMGVLGMILAAFLLILSSKEERAPGSNGWAKSAAKALGAVFRNPQSILCGLIAGLLFIPTTIFDLTWALRSMPEAGGLDYAAAVLRSPVVPIGWILGCPLLGFISDRLGRRKPVILGGAAALLSCVGWVLYGRSGIFPPALLGLIMGLASGAAMLPYTVIREVNPPEYGGTATGVINFLTFTFSALMGPVFAWFLRWLSSGIAPMAPEHYRMAFVPLLYGIGLAMFCSLFLKETGPLAPRRPISPMSRRVRT